MLRRGGREVDLCVQDQPDLQTSERRNPVSKKKKEKKRMKEKEGKNRKRPVKERKERGRGEERGEEGKKIKVHPYSTGPLLYVSWLLFVHLFVSDFMSV